MTTDGFLAIQRKGVQLSQELFGCILEFASKIIREGMGCAKFDIEGFCSGVIVTNPVVPTSKSTSDFGAAFLVKSVVKYEDGSETFIEFFLPKEAKYLHPQIESYVDKVSDLCQHHMNN